MIKQIIKIILVPFIFSLHLYSQSTSSITLPYSCGFEDSLEVLNWKLNVGANGSKCRDQWMIGNTDNHEGYNSLYISCDSGYTTNYGAEPNMTIAYRTIEIPSSFDPTKRSYSVDISFDYKCTGKDRVAMLKFWFLPLSILGDESVLKSSHRSNDLPFELTHIPSDATFWGEQDWVSWSMVDNNYRSHSLLPDTKYCLLFIWQNSNVDTAQNHPQAAVIDNIQITLSDCWKPNNIKTKTACDTLWVEWEGSNERYEFEYRPSGNGKWRGNIQTAEKNIMIPNIAEGAYDIRVRGLCRDTRTDGWNMSAWVTMNSVICFCPERHCINYVTLDRPGVSCLVGKASDPTLGGFSLRPTTLGNYGAGPLDYGESAMRSRHTVNWKRGVYDPRTGNVLSTIPDGSLASVRLGNWDIDAQAECIVYEHYVDTAEAYIILMKYAVVLENPGHGPKADPYFKLELLDEYDRPIDRKCGEFEFTPEGAGMKWHVHENFVWKEWTAIGMNLSDYHGQTIKIRLITQDCTHTAHAGYAYFTLDCVNAVIKSTSCGETVEMEMMAPDGFRYFWSREENRDSVISNERKFSVPANDTATYYCDVEYIDVEGCGFTLSTAVFPRFPHAEFDWEWIPENCENKIFLRNKSCVHTRIDSVDVPTDEMCETAQWIINDGEYETATTDVSYVVPNEGDTLSIVLISGISDDACQDVDTMVIVVPPIYSHRDTLNETYCEGSVRQFDKKTIATSGVYTEHLYNCWGCDSITTLNLNFKSRPDDVYISDTICANEDYFFNGEKITKSDRYRTILKSDYGCDSVVFLDILVEEPIDIDVDDDEINNLFFCSDESSFEINYNLVEGSREPKLYSVLFDDLAHQCGFIDEHSVAVDSENKTFSIKLPENCRPNIYTATILFEDESLICTEDTIGLSFEVHYSSSILDPKFGNLIAIYDSENNGGYTFVSYQWYKNGEPLEGETESFLYLGDGEFFNSEDCYYLMLTRADDGVVLPTCEVCPGLDTSIENVLADNDLLDFTIFDRAQRVYLDKDFIGQIFIYSLTGQLLNTYEIDENTPYFVSPNQMGVYMVHFVSQNYNVGYKIVVR